MKGIALFIIALTSASGFAETHVGGAAAARGSVPTYVAPQLSEILDACLKGQPFPKGHTEMRPAPELPTMAMPGLPVSMTTSSTPAPAGSPAPAATPAAPPSPVKKVEIECRAKSMGNIIRVDLGNRAADIKMRPNDPPQDLGKCDLISGFTRTLTCESKGFRLFLSGDDLLRGVIKVDDAEDQLTCEKKS